MWLAYMSFQLVILGEHLSTRVAEVEFDPLVCILTCLLKLLACKTTFPYMLPISLPLEDL